jgi:hypothetical protein
MRGKLKLFLLACKLQLVNKWGQSGPKNIMTGFNVAFRMPRDLLVLEKLPTPFVSLNVQSVRRTKQKCGGTRFRTFGRI